MNRENNLLFRYRGIASIEFVINELVNKYIWLSEPNKLNDPLEGLAFYDLFKNDSKIRSLASRGDLNKTYSYDFLNDTHKHVQLNKKVEDEYHQSKLLLQMQEKSKNSRRIAALTDDPFSLPMWGQYASNFEGLVIGYDKQLLSQIVEEQKCEIKSVNYFSHSEFSQKFCSENWYFTKTVDWEYEKETRIISENFEQNKLFLDKYELCLRWLIFGYKLRKLKSESYLTLKKLVETIYPHCMVTISYPDVVAHRSRLMGENRSHFESVK